MVIKKKGASTMTEINPVRYHVLSKDGRNGRELTVSFQLWEDNALNAGGWRDVDCNGRLNEGDYFLYGKADVVNPKWHEATEEEIEKFGQFVKQEVSRWDFTLSMWAANASQGTCGLDPFGNRFLTIPGTWDRWIQTGGVFLLQTSFPLPYVRIAATVEQGSRDYLLLLSAFQGCFSKRES